MSTKKKLLEAAAGNAGGGVYVDDVFSTYLYEGTGSGQTITNGIDLDGEGGLVWVKDRDGVGQEHFLVDSERGIGKYLATNATQQEVTYNPAYGITSFNSTGFAIGLPYGGNVNNSNTAYASWTFRKQPGFFDVVTYTGSGAFNGDTKTVSHNLGTTPGMIIFKRTDAGGTNWIVAHRSLSTNHAILLNSTAAEYAVSPTFDYVSNFTDTTFTVHRASDATLSTNAPSSSMVAYLFAHDAQDFGTDSDESIIKCGSYTGTGSAGNSINLGFEPQWLLVKSSTTSDNWRIIDVMRGWTADGLQQNLNPNASFAENSTSTALKPTADGFSATGSNMNNSGVTYIYVAIRRPHKPASEFAATDLFTPATGTTDYSGPQYDAGFPVVDLIFEFLTITGAVSTVDRVRGDQKRLRTYSTDAETTSSIPLDMMYGAGDGGNSYAQSWMFRRAPGFFDVVAYTGDGSAGRNINHNLGVAPELMIIKQRNATRSWAVYNSSSGTGKFLKLEDAAGEVTQSGVFDTAPTESVFTVETNTYVNINGGFYISYLFATVPGISKVGSYSGTGSDVNVDCGFTSGARFVLVKRTDSTGDWYLWDSVRGIVAGNDPYLFLNSTAAQVTSTDYIDPLSSGFTITSGAPAALNASGGNYIFLAIA